MILALDTSLRQASVALCDGERTVAETSFTARATHSETVLPAVDRLLSEAGCTPSDVREVVVGEGPGSFTGVRIAAAIAKGWCHATGADLFAYSSLAAVAASTGEPRVSVLFDARRGQVYAATFAGGDYGAPAAGPVAIHIDDWLERFATGKGPAVGDGAHQHAAAIRERGGSVLSEELGAPRAAWLGWLRYHDPDRGRVVDPAGWEPAYVRAPQAVREAAGTAGP